VGELKEIRNKAKKVKINANKSKKESFQR